MKTVTPLLASVLLATALTAHAGPISLPPIGNASSADIVKTLNVYGSCGGSVVQIIGIMQESFGPDKETFSFDSGAEVKGIFILAGNGTPAKRLQASDYNVALCVPVGAGFRLVVGSGCAGSVCGDAMTYIVFDPKAGKNVAPSTCGIACASKLINSNVLKKRGLM